VASPPASFCFWPWLI